MLRILACPWRSTSTPTAAEAETFVGAMDREYYLHFAGHKQELEIEPIYDRHRGLFERAAVEELRERLAKRRRATNERRARYLLELAVGGFMGEATKAEETALAEREATLEIEVDGRREAYRQASIVQANEPDPDRRARDRAGAPRGPRRGAQPAARRGDRALARARARARLGELPRDVRGAEGGRPRRARAADAALSRRRPAATYRERVEPQLREQIGIGFDALRRSDLPYFFRAPAYDALFPGGAPAARRSRRRWPGSASISRAQANVQLDTEQRPQKSPRAFCSPVHVPNEVYLVIPRTGGRDDFAALFHEGGHTEHYANVDPSLPFEFRHLGDNSVTEGFAFLLEHLIEDPTWLRTVLGVEDAGRPYLDVRARQQARVPAPLRGEAQLRARAPRRRARAGRDAAALRGAPERRGRRRLAARHLPLGRRPRLLRGQLPARLGVRDAPAPASCASASARSGSRAPEAGDLLRSIWREGQRLDADELLAQVTDEQLDFGVMLDEV